MSGAIKRKSSNGGAKHELDKFYTKTDVSQSLIESIKYLIDVSDIVVEPSAGSGAFSNYVKHKNFFAFDIEPESETVVKKDWFDVDRDDIGPGSLLVLGNPPFGVRGDLAKRFISHSAGLGAETVAFILPTTFSKVLNQSEKIFHKDYRLVVEKELPNYSFLLSGDEYHIPCTWYVWTKNQSFLLGVDKRKKKAEQSPDFVFLARGDINADFTINGNSGKVKDLEQVTNPKAEHYIGVVDSEMVKHVRNKFQNLDLQFMSSVNGGISWIGKQEILAAYSKF